MVTLHDGPPDSDPVPPADLAAVQADDALLNDRLGPDDTGDADARLARMFMRWRQDIESEPVTSGMDVDTALAAVRQATHHRRWRHIRAWLSGARKWMGQWTR